MTEHDKADEQSSAEDLASLVPKRRSNSPVALLLLGAIGVVGAGAWYYTVGGSTSSEDASASTDEVSRVAAAMEDQAPANLPAAPPPPPPPPPAVTAEAVSTASEATSGEATSVKARPPKNDDQCGDPCTGNANSAFEGALRRRGQLARSCYDAALRQDSTLSGKLLVRVRVSPTGGVCNASIVQDDIGSSVINTCVLSKFRSAGFPPPSGGCVDGQVPLNFVSKP